MSRLFFTVYLVKTVIMVYHNWRIVQKIFYLKVVKFTGSFIERVEDDVDFGSRSQGLSHLQELTEYFVVMFEVKVLIKHEFCSLTDSISQVRDWVFGTELISFVANKRVVEMQFHDVVLEADHDVIRVGVKYWKTAAGCSIIMLKMNSTF